MYDARTMNELAPRQRTRPPLFFEKDGNEGWSPTTHLGDGHGACHD